MRSSLDVDLLLNHRTAWENFIQTLLWTGRWNDHRGKTIFVLEELKQRLENVPVKSLLEQHLEEGNIRLKDDTYIGFAKDGTPVQFGMKGEENAVELYLLENRTPETW